ncbi:SAM-dependent methyltransferase [Azospirillum lipoferum]|uniref:Class I SAM-dependent methyltransferase n=1 Tax=Azospirillum lipoferum TaxID=193 RepID=A0A5A9GKH6_AZOLI|nr:MULTISPECIES: class I SAM-dependent methyltransferase [Azospirillum]KAA0593739.1 class I SAM-dependent methyltransferase [Azospirillum lipoferum]MCP1614214.1 SAM-dependent methyltransferase [Azospirillum lipoferum]MDW5536899.1 class I SAM-dependent methyltransferase [Azospirillum sp. NL1]
MMTTPSCHLCGHDALHEVAGYGRLLRITSDVRIWPAGGRLAVCRACGAVQKPATAAWRSECQAIYSTYVVYRQNGGNEQAVFASSGGGEARSLLLLRKLVDGFGLPSDGHHLDFGCGDGSLLRNAAALLPAWKRAGAELNDSRRPEIEAIPGVEDFYAGSPSAIPRRFDLVTTVHVLEHFERPMAILSTLVGMLVPDGKLVIEVPDLRTSPFDLLIADHATHFTPAVLRNVLTESGLYVDCLTDSWIPRELSVVARHAALPEGTAVLPTDPPADQVWRASLERVEHHIDWLTRLRDSARAAAVAGPVGIFGTSIAATWLAAHVSDSIAFFVDEDMQRVGGTYLGRPILHPRQVPDGARVFVAHTPAFADKIACRLAELDRFTVIRPPDGVFV